TVHDLIHRHYPESVPTGYRLFMAAAQPRAARRAERVIVDSWHVAREVVELLGVRPERVRVVPLGPGHGFRPVEDEGTIDRVLARFGARRPYVVAVGRGYPHKNVAGLMRAVALVRGRGHGDLQLVLVGDRYRSGPELDGLAVQLGIAKAVVWTGFAGQAEL